MKRVLLFAAALMLLCLGASAQAELVILGGRTFSHTTFQLPGGARTYLAAESLGDSAFFAGGGGPASVVVDRYNPTEGQSWRSSSCPGDGVDPLSAPRFVPSAASSGGRLFVAGGFPGTTYPNSTVDIYDASGARVGQTYITGLAGNGRGAMASASADGKVFFAGGDSNAGADWMGISVDTVDMIDAATLARRTMSLSTPRSYLMGASVGHEVLFAGGEYTPLGGNYYDSRSRVDIYDTQLDQWRMAELSVARFEGAGATAGGRAFFAGGAWNEADGRTFHSSAAVDIYDSNTGLWTTAALSEARWALAGVGFGDLVFFAGGINDPIVKGDCTSYSNVVDIYDNATNTWYTATLSQARGCLRATVVGDQILFAGGTYMEGGQRLASDVVDVFTLQPVPEPSSLLVLAGGLGTLLGIRRRRA